MATKKQTQITYKKTPKRTTATKKIKTPVTVSKRAFAYETDSTFFLKLVVFMVLGAQWVFIQTSADSQFPIPIGLILGLVFASHEHFQIDRKIEYAVMLVSMFVAFWLPLGLVIQL